MGVTYSFRFDIHEIMLVIKSAIFRIICQVDDEVPYLSIYLFKMKIYRRVLKIKPNRKLSAINLVQMVDFTNRNTTVGYGFYDPSTTGLLYSAISTFSDIKQVPDFLPEYEYIIVDGSAHIYLWTTIMKYIKHRRKDEY